jgi:hypothetical protein
VRLDALIISAVYSKIVPVFAANYGDRNLFVKTAAKHITTREPNPQTKGDYCGNVGYKFGRFHLTKIGCGQSEKFTSIQ